MFRTCFALRGPVFTAFSSRNLVAAGYLEVWSNNSQRLGMTPSASKGYRLKSLRKMGRGKLLNLWPPSDMAAPGLRSLLSSLFYLKKRLCNICYVSYYQIFVILNIIYKLYIYNM